MVIFLDEIQCLINWNLQNDFIGVIKSLSSEVNNEILRKLNFVILGMAKPSEILTNKEVAFNTGSSPLLTCRQLNNQEELKVIIIGFGSDVNRDPKFYLNLDANMNSFKDRHSKPCNIVVFDLLNKMDGIIDL